MKTPAEIAAEIRGHWLIDPTDSRSGHWLIDLTDSRSVLELIAAGIEADRAQRDDADAQTRLGRIAGLINDADDGAEPPSLREIYLITEGRA